MWRLWSPLKSTPCGQSRDAWWGVYGERGAVKGGRGHRRRKHKPARLVSQCPCSQELVGGKCWALGEVAMSPARPRGLELLRQSRANWSK